jgi:hypothetical protein
VTARRDPTAAVWLNEYHADYLAHDRMAEAQARAARRQLLAAARLPRPCLRVRIGRALIRLGRWMAERAEIQRGACIPEAGRRPGR